MENYLNLIPPFSIDLETSSQCQYDNVKIYDGASRQRSKVLGTFCRYVCLKKRTRSCLILASYSAECPSKKTASNESDFIPLNLSICSQRSEPVVSSGNSMVVVFRTDRSHGGRGFHARYFIDCNK